MYNKQKAAFSIFFKKNVKWRDYAALLSDKYQADAPPDIRKDKNMGERIELLPGVFLSGRQTERFKTACLSLSMIRPLRREEAAMNALLPAVLMRGTRKYPTLRDISAFLDEQYGASVGTLVRKNGEIQTTGFYLSFLEDRFSPGGEEILDPMIDFLRQLLLEPVLQEGVFPQKFVEGEKWNLVNAIESALNDKRAYASEKMLALLCGEDGYGVPRLGTVEDVEAITPQSLYEHYQSLLKTSRVELFYCGGKDLRTVGAKLKAALAPLGTKSPVRVSSAAFQPTKESRYGEETMEVSQGKLSMGFSTGCTARDPGFPALMVLNACYGAGMTSKLFQNVRERLSLCYYASSGIHGAKGLMTVSSGIDPKNFETAKAEILAQLDACRRGEITAEELENGKKAILTSLETIPDSPGRMEDYTMYSMLSGQNMEIEEYAKAVQAVTVEQAVEAAKKIRLEAVFFLKGVRA